MELTGKHLTRIADAIRDKLKLLRNHRYREVQRLIYVVTNHQIQLERIRHGLERSVYRDWDAAARELTMNAQRIIRDIPHASQELERAAMNSQTKTPIPRELYEELKHYNIYARRYFYPLICDYSCYKSVAVKDSLTVARKVSERILTLPIHYDLSLDDVQRICNIIAIDL